MSSNINNVNSPVKKGDIITMTNDKVISTQMKITTESVEVSPPRNDLNNEEKKVINDKKQRKPRRSKEEIAAEKAEKIAIKEKKAALKASKEQEKIQKAEEKAAKKASKEQEKIQKAEEKAANKASKEQEKKRIIEEKATQKKARKPNRSKEEIQAEKQAKAEAKEKKAILKQAREAEKKRLAEEKAAAKANKVKKQYEVDVDILSPITNDNSTQGSPKKNDDKEIKKESPQNNEENKCDDEFNAIFQNDGIENDEDSDSDTCAEIDNEFIEEKFNKFKSLIKKAEEQEANRTQRTRGHDAWLEELKSFYTEFAVMLGHDGSI